MAEVKWIKLATDIFDNRKIRQIEQMPDGDAIIVVWLKLLTAISKTAMVSMIQILYHALHGETYANSSIGGRIPRPLRLGRNATSPFQY
jgi:hypothetical protein